MKKHALILRVVCLSLLSLLSYAQAPVPFVNQPLVPDSALPGGPSFCLTVNGVGFVPDSIVKWNSHTLVTRFVSATKLKATVPAVAIALPTTAWVTVVNPGGATSNISFFTVTPNAADNIAFTQTSSPNAGTSPTSPAVGDFNGDGKLDLVVANSDAGTVSVLLGDGQGNFTLASSPSTGSGPSAVVVGDFNGDGKADLAVANYNDNTVAVLLGDGTGNFTLASSTVVGANPRVLVAGDFNADGKLDLAVNNNSYSGTDGSILLGDGAGNFTLASSIPSGAAMAAGDFNSDGKLDVAIMSGAILNIMLGDGTGNFTLGFALGWECCGPFGYPYSIAAGDFNGDGALDLAVMNSCFMYHWDCYPGSFITVLLGDGYGNFGEAFDPKADGGDIVVADLNGDGSPDLFLGSGQFLLGDSTGNFPLKLAIGKGGSPAMGDLNGDGKLDVATADPGANELSIFLQVHPAEAALTPASLDFGSQSIDTTSAPKTITLSNPGSTDLNIASIVSADKLWWYEAGPNFQQTNNCGATLSPGQSCTISVTLRPLNPGGLTGTVLVADNAAHSPQTVSLTGVGIDGVTVSPKVLDFGSQPLGTTSSRTGSITWHLHFPFDYWFVLDGDESVWSSSDAYSSFGVTFAPKSIGTQTATLWIVWLDEIIGCYGWCFSGSVAATLTGVGTAVTLTPPSLTFGDQQVRTPSPAQIVILGNFTGAPLRISALRFGGANPDSFAQTNNCGTTLAAGASCAIAVTFRPTSVCAKTATLSIFDNAYGSPHTIALTGVGTLLTVSPPSLNFGNQPVGIVSPAQTVTLTNHGNNALNIYSIRLTGTNPQLLP